jgi:peptide/nickel transport system permease protein
MKRHLYALCLVLLVLLAIFGPEFLGKDGSQAPPYSKPWWLSRDIASSIVLYAAVNNPEPVEDLPEWLSVLPSSDSVSLEWEYKPPMRVSLTGRLDRGFVGWITPRGRFVLADTPGELDLDARDIPFKKTLGVKPFDDLPSILFPSRGSYVLSLVGGGEVTMKIEGGRWGWLGTDHRGRDTVTLFIRGIRISLIVGLAATLIATFLGLSMGLLSGYAGGFTDTVIMRAVDVLLSIPTLPILMIMAAMWGKGLWNLVLVLSAFSWMGTARTVRSMTLSLRDAPWVENLRAIGAKRNYILFRHLIPEALPLLLANVALGVPGAILAEAGLAFLGLSDPRIPSWGRMLHEAYTFGAFSSGAWWVILPPGLGLSMICLLFMTLGRKLEERADPRLTQKN